MTSTRPATTPPLVTITGNDEATAGITGRRTPAKVVDVRGAFVRKFDAQPDGSIRVAFYSKFMHGRANQHRIPAGDGTATVLTVAVSAYDDNERSAILDQLNRWSRNSEALVVFAAPDKLGAIVDIYDTALVFNTGPPHN